MVMNGCMGYSITVLVYFDEEEEEGEGGGGGKEGGENQIDVNHFQEDIGHLTCFFF
jgi:hypothetical protein